MAARLEDGQVTHMTLLHDDKVSPSECMAAHAVVGSAKAVVTILPSPSSALCCLSLDRALDGGQPFCRFRRREQGILNVFYTPKLSFCRLVEPLTASDCRASDLGQYLNGREIYRRVPTGSEGRRSTYYFFFGPCMTTFFRPVLK